MKNALPDSSFNADDPNSKIPPATSSNALVAITLHGCKLALKIDDLIKHQQSLAVDFYFPQKFHSQIKGLEKIKTARFFTGKAKNVLSFAFENYSGIIALFSLGALIRLMAPLLKSKQEDPGVVVIDEKGNFAISVLSGHMGGGNELCRTMAQLTGAQAVITTASDVQGTIPVDILGKNYNWTMEPSDFLTPISAAIVNEEPVAFIQESGENVLPDPLPSNLHLYSTLQEALSSQTKTVILITHRQLTPDELNWLSNKQFVLYHPKTIGIGLGCNRGTKTAEISAVVAETLAELNLSPMSIRTVASIDLKSNEQGLLDFCQQIGLKPEFYSPKQLNAVDIDHPSDVVFKYTGSYGVSEPAAKLITKNKNLLLAKKVSGNVTISLGITIEF